MTLTKILHISNTDIVVDSRIRKELTALTQLADTQVSVVGVPARHEKSEVTLDGVRYRQLRLASRTLDVLPRALRYPFELVEFTTKAVIAGRRMRPDIVHCHDTFSLPAGWILKWSMRCQLVYDAHELESKKNAQTVVLSFATLLIEKLCWKQVDLLVSVSDSIIEWYQQNLGSKPSVLVLNSPAIANDPAPDASTQGCGRYFHEKYDIPADDLVFVYVGILGPGRGIQLCLDAFASGPKDTHIVFIGFGHLQMTIAEYVERHPNIHMHEPVPHDRVVALVRNADYGLCLVENVSLSYYYCLPNKLFEYIFARIPVLASDFPEIRRLMQRYSLGVCCAPRTDCLRSVLAQLSGRRPDPITSDIAALSWETQAFRLRAAYQQLLGANDGAEG